MGLVTGLVLLTAAVFGFRAGRWVADPVHVPLGAVLLAGLPVRVLADGSVRGGFGVLFGVSSTCTCAGGSPP